MAARPILNRHINRNCQSAYIRRTPPGDQHSKIVFYDSWARCPGLQKLAGGSDAHIANVIIPRTEVSRIKEELVVSGIDEVTIFPDLDGLGRFLTTVLQSEADAK